MTDTNKCNSIHRGGGNWYCCELTKGHPGKHAQTEIWESADSISKKSTISDITKCKFCNFQHEGMCWQMAAAANTSEDM